jgi:molecular chaperone DnaK (HSP70)
MKLMEQALEESKLKKSSIDDIILVGESTVGVSLMLEKYFSRVPFKGVDPEVAIAHGAAIQADILRWQDRDGGCYFPIEIHPFTLGKQAVTSFIPM